MSDLLCRYPDVRGVDRGDLRHRTFSRGIDPISAPIMTIADREALAKVPAVTLMFWIIKILATTLGETAGDTVSMSMNLGYLVGTAIFMAILVVLVWRQVAAERYRPFLYWATIIASTTAGTTLADFATRSLGIGYPGGSLILFTCVGASLWLWHRMLGSVSVATIHTPRAELFYWVTITFSQTLGTGWGTGRPIPAGLAMAARRSCSGRCWPSSRRCICGRPSTACCCSGARSS